jgi:LPS O-antigen subunit length determinant protein (WzzB/FepE family)
VVRLNERLRERALREAETNVAFLRAELAQTSVVTLQQSIGRLLESELQKLMLARGNEEFAFRVIDAASPPKQRVRPKRAQIAILGTILGGMLAVFGVFLLHVVRSEAKMT